MKKRRAALPLADLVSGTISECCARQGFAAVEVVTHWSDIIGEELASRAVPVRLVWPRREDVGATGVLHVRVEGAYAIELQHMAPIVMERINRYFGWRCVGRIAMRQGPIAGIRPVRRRPPEPDAFALAEVAAGLGAFEDSALAESLARLGALVRRDAITKR